MHGFRKKSPQTSEQLRIAANPQCISTFTPLFDDFSLLHHCGWGSKKARGGV
jgi:hypothetical protein